jgi:choline dehydrogenase-like flavoprotein
VDRNGSEIVHAAASTGASCKPRESSDPRPAGGTHWGYPIARLDWRWSEIDLLGIRRVRQIFASELQTGGLGDLVEAEKDIDPDVVGNGPVTAHHHLGTTRMHDLPSHGVVDRDCRLQGSSLVYVAGGSVFPTCGGANPTLTVVALTIRLADRLKRAMSAR